jgi:hypothetical protein
MNKFGDFTSEAYDALRSAYADQLSAPLEEERTGYDVAGQNYPLETEDARGDYLKSTGLWKYPSGHSDYERPDPDSLITALRTTDGGEEDGGEEEIDSLIDELLGEEEANNDESE